jgi:outer membrane biosynthesis protein TonB
MPMKRIASLAVLAVATSACAAAQAKAPADRPALEVPVAPPRVIEKAAQELAMPEPVSELPPPPTAAPRPRPPAPAREAPKPEPKPETPVEAPQTAAAPPAPVPPILRTPGTANSAGVSRQVSDLLDRAKKALASIDYRRLTKDRKAEYERAKLMITESEQAVKAANFESALGLADKAERLTKELQTR